MSGPSFVAARPPKLRVGLTAASEASATETQPVSAEQVTEQMSTLRPDTYRQMFGDIGNPIHGR